MARIKGKDLYLKDDDQIYFGDNKEAAMWYSGSDLMLDHTISGTAAIQGYHLLRKDQMEEYVDTVASGIDEFTDLIDTPASYSGLGQHYVTVKADGSGLEFTTTSGFVDIERFGPGDFIYDGFPPLKAFLGPVSALAFPDAEVRECWCNFKVPANWKVDTDISVKLYWMNNTAQTGTNTVRWGVEYRTFEHGDTYGSKTSTATELGDALPNNANAGTFSLFEIGSMPYDNANNPFQAGTVITFRLYRDAIDAGDTVTGYAAVLLLTFEFQTEVPNSV